MTWQTSPEGLWVPFSVEPLHLATTGWETWFTCPAYGFLVVTHVDWSQNDALTVGDAAYFGVGATGSTPTIFKILHGIHDGDTFTTEAGSDVGQTVMPGESVSVTLSTAAPGGWVSAAVQFWRSQL